MLIKSILKTVYFRLYRLFAVIIMNISQNLTRRASMHEWRHHFLFVLMRMLQYFYGFWHFRSQGNCTTQWRMYWVISLRFAANTQTGKCGSPRGKANSYQRLPKTAKKRQHENNKTTVIHNLQWTEAHIITPITENCHIMRERNLALAFIRRDVGRMQRWVWHSVVWLQMQPFTVHCNGNIWSEQWHCTKIFFFSSANTLHLTETASNLRQTHCLLDDKKTQLSQCVALHFTASRESLSSAYKI